MQEVTMAENEEIPMSTIIQTRSHLRWPLTSVFEGGCDHLDNALQSKSAARAADQF